MHNCEDIWSQWTTSEKINIWFDDTNVVLVDTQFSEDGAGKEMLPEEKLFIPECKRRHIITFDKIDRPLSNKGT